jgi:hypothetical protein
VKKRSTRIWCERNTSFWEEKFRKQWIDCSQYNSTKPPRFRGVRKEVEALEHNRNTFAVEIFF